VIAATPRRAALFVFTMVLLDILGLGLILPVLPQLIMGLTGEGLSEAARYGGWLWFTYAITQFFFAPILGGLSDRFGRRPVLLVATLAYGVDYLIMGFAPTLFWLFIGRFISGVSGATFTTGFAYMADISPPEKRAQNFGLIGAAFGLGFILGPAVGGLLGGLSPRAPFIVAGLLALANFAFGYFVVPESLPPERRRKFELQRANPLGTLLKLRSYPAVLGLATALFVWQLGHQALPGTWSYYAMYKFGWEAGMVGASLAFAGVLMAFSQAGLSRVLVPRFGESRIALAGLVSGTLTYIGYALATQGWMIFAVMLMWLPAALVFPTLNALMSHRVPADAQGELQGGISSLQSLSAIAGPMAMTQLFGYFTSEAAPWQVPGAPFVAAALLSALALVILLRQRLASPRHPGESRDPVS
jgi:MFS transporter, DHA1 family, tetracycline resistance protein